MNFDLGVNDWMKEEPLHPDLEQYIRTGTVMGDMVHSPLIVTALSMERNRCSDVNDLYTQKLAHLAEAIAERRWSRAFFIRPDSASAPPPT